MNAGRELDSRNSDESAERQCRLTSVDQGRLLEAALFASAAPLSATQLRRLLPDDADLDALLSDLKARYMGRGVMLTAVAGGYAFRTAPDLTSHLRLEKRVARKLSRAAMETLAIIAYHQPVTRAQIEDIRGVETSKGTVDALIEAGWIKPGSRRKTPGRPLTWTTTAAFLDHFDLQSLDDLPGLEDLKASGLLQTGHNSDIGPDSGPPVNIKTHASEDENGD
jgi:segregation and condensation protein B